MTAKQMFKDIGYKLVENTKLYTTYHHKIEDFNLLKMFVFNKTKKYIAVDIFKADGNQESVPMQNMITLDELQAINKQVEELGWEE